MVLLFALIIGAKWRACARHRWESRVSLVCACRGSMKIQYEILNQKREGSFIVFGADGGSHLHSSIATIESFLLLYIAQTYTISFVGLRLMCTFSFPCPYEYDCVGP